MRLSSEILRFLQTDILYINIMVKTPEIVTVTLMGTIWNERFVMRLLRKTHKIKIKTTMPITIRIQYNYK